MVGLSASVGLALYFTRSSAGGSVVAGANPEVPGVPSTSLEMKYPAAAPVAPTKGADPPHSKGASAATLTLEEFADFECPACSHFYPLLKSIEGEYGKRVRVIFRQFPLPQHKYAVKASRAAEAAGLQGKFWEMHDLLYENRTTWSEATDVRPIFEDYARRLGLNIEKFNRDQYGSEVGGRLTQDFQRGRSLRINATPTVYLNGNEMPYSQIKSVDSLRAALDEALTKTSR